MTPMAERTGTAVFERDGDWWVAQAEELPAALTQGTMLEEARENLKDAIRMVLASYRETAGPETYREEIVVTVYVKRSSLLTHRHRHRCELLREGDAPSLYWNPANGHWASVPRHTAIANVLARAICRQLGIPEP
jgi:mRNA interferase HicA